MNQGSLNVLVVTNEDAVASAIASFLRHRGHIVTTAENAREALRLPQPDVLIADLEIEGATNGFELVEEMRGQGLGPRAILYTDSPSVDIFRSAAELGCTRILLKPIELDRLIEAVESVESPDFDDEFEDNVEEEESPRLEAGYMSNADCVDAAARDVAAFALRLGIGPSGRCRIASSVAELMENSRRHGYANKLGTIALTATTRGRTLEVTVHDLGQGFESSSVVTDVLLSGHGGFARASSLSEGMRIESSIGNGTRAYLEFNAFPVKFDDEHIVDLSELDFLPPDLAKKIVNFLESEDGESPFRLSPALAVTVGRLLAGPDSPQVQQDALWS